MKYIIIVSYFSIMANDNQIAMYDGIEYNSRAEAEQVARNAKVRANEALFIRERSEA